MAEKLGLNLLPTWSLMIWTHFQSNLLWGWCSMNYMHHAWYRAKVCLTMILRLNEHDFMTWDLLSFTYWVLFCVHLKECNFRGTGFKLTLFLMVYVLDL